MANYFTECDDRLFRFGRMDFKRTIAIREEDFSEAAEYDFAPVDYEDCLDNYQRILDLIGGIAGERLAPNAEQIDREGNTHENWQVTYHPKGQEAIDAFTQAECMALTIPRKYSGLNMPTQVTTLFVEMLAQADPGLMTVIGLQDIGETLYMFGDHEQCMEFLPDFSTGSTGAMVLTEPDAGSDLQAVMLRADPDEFEEGLWRLNGVKRFITNGCGDILLVLARSEPNSKDGRGLSLFVARKGEGVKIRRIEHKLGIRSSPTCEIQFENTPCYLIGRRKRGLTQYVMALMNGARLGIAAQSVGLAEAAYIEARNYAESREQFGLKIRDMPAVYDMLLDMRVMIEAGRALLYHCTNFVEISKTLGKKMELRGDKDVELKREVRRNTLMADLTTPMVKYYASEMVNTVCNMAIQVLGGSGFMQDYPLERYMRDARIMNIYEGTSQLQVVAILPRIMKGVHKEFFAEFQAKEFTGLLDDAADKIKKRIPQFRKCITILKEVNSREFSNYFARSLVDICTDIYLSILLLDDGLANERKAHVARLFIAKAITRIDQNVDFIVNRDTTAIEHYMEVIGPATVV